MGRLSEQQGTSGEEGEEEGGSSGSARPRPPKETDTEFSIRYIKMGVSVSSSSFVYLPWTTVVNYIDTKAKCRYLKNLPAKV